MIDHSSRASITVIVCVLQLTRYFGQYAVYKYNVQSNHVGKIDRGFNLLKLFNFKKNCTSFSPAILNTVCLELDLIKTFNIKNLQRRYCLTLGKLHIIFSSYFEHCMSRTWSYQDIFNIKNLQRRY